MNRIEKIFEKCRAENRKTLVVFAECGCPTLPDSEALIARQIEAGADIIELGVPFSDPTADGAVIQEASQIALRAGTKFTDIIAMASRLRIRYPDTGLIVFSYFNVLLNYGPAECARDLRAAGVDGILSVDLPFEERDELKAHCDREGLHLIPLLSPATSPARAEKITAGATGFVYYVTVRGVTGTRATLPAELAEQLECVRKISPVPVVAGFGIASPEAAREIGIHADGVVVGSAAVRLAMRGESPAALVKSLAAALR